MLWTLTDILINIVLMDGNLETDFDIFLSWRLEKFMA